MSKNFAQKFLDWQEEVLSDDEIEDKCGNLNPWQEYETHRLYSERLQIVRGGKTIAIFEFAHDADIIYHDLSVLSYDGDQWVDGGMTTIAETVESILDRLGVDGVGEFDGDNTITVNDCN